MRDLRAPDFRFEALERRFAIIRPCNFVEFLFERMQSSNLVADRSVDGASYRCFSLDIGFVGFDRGDAITDKGANDGGNAERRARFVDARIDALGLNGEHVLVIGFVEFADLGNIIVIVRLCLVHFLYYGFGTRVLCCVLSSDSGIIARKIQHPLLKQVITRATLARNGFLHLTVDTMPYRCGVRIYAKMRRFVNLKL